MKKKILALTLLASATMLTSCTDPSDDNSVSLQNSLIFLTSSAQDIQLVGINQADIPGFVNSDGPDPVTQVTVTYTPDDATEQAIFVDDCSILAADANAIDSAPYTATSDSLVRGNSPDSLLGELDCSSAPTGTYTTGLRISFTAGGKSYTANTTLTAIV